MTMPCGDATRFTDTELRVILDALNAYEIKHHGPVWELKQRALKKVAAALAIAERPFVEKGPDGRT